MTTHKRSDHITAISVSIPKDLLVLVDQRAASLKMNRSQYLAQLVRGDIIEGGTLTIHESPKSVLPAVPKPVGSRELTKYPPLSKPGSRGKTGG